MKMFLKSVTPLVTSVRTHLGYIPYEGRLGYQLQTNAQKFYSEHKKANLQPVAKVTYTFDPMTSNWNSLRNFMFFWQTKKVRATAPKLITKTKVVDDRREPTILFNLTDGRELEVTCWYKKKDVNYIFLSDQDREPDGARNCYNSQLLYFAPREGC